MPRFSDRSGGTYPHDIPGMEVKKRHVERRLAVEMGHEKLWDEVRLYNKTYLYLPMLDPNQVGTTKDLAFYNHDGEIRLITVPRGV